MVIFDDYPGHVAHKTTWRFALENNDYGHALFDSVIVKDGYRMINHFNNNAI